LQADIDLNILVNVGLSGVAKINSEQAQDDSADQYPSMELNLNEVSRVSAPGFFEFTIAVSGAENSWSHRYTRDLMKTAISMICPHLGS